MTQPFTRLTLETLYGDGHEYRYVAEKNADDMTLSDLFELFESLAHAAGYSKETIQEMREQV